MVVLYIILAVLFIALLWGYTRVRSRRIHS
jgi:hypothetical protein